MTSRAEKRRADREGSTLSDAKSDGIVQDMVGAGNGIVKVDGVVVQSRVPDWAYHGHTDAVQDNSIPWDPKSVVAHPRKKVAIIGFTPTRADAPYIDPEYEIWGENALFVHRDVPRCSRWFDLHAPGLLDEQRINFYSQIDVPVFLQDARDDVPGSFKFPKKQIEQFVAGLAPGSANMLGDYQTNSISWMIAFAMWEGFTTIDIYGVDMSQDCLAPDAKVLTADLRYIPASEVNVGDKLLGFDDEPGANDKSHIFRQWDVAEVMGVSKAQRPSYRIHLEDGTKVVASAGHRWLTYAEHQLRWKRTDELVTNAHRDGRPTRIVRAVDVWDTDDSRDGGYLAAAFDGEGSVSQTVHKHCNGHALGLGFAQRENAMADVVRVALAERGFTWGEYGHDKDTGRDVWDDEAGVAVAAEPTISYAIHGGRPEIMRFLGEIRPARLLERFDPSKLGSFQRSSAVAVERIEFIGEQETIGFTTSTQTLIVEGLASHNSEYRFQKSCVEYFLGMCRGRGIEVNIPDTSDLLKATHQYGYGSDNGYRAKLMERKKEFEERLTHFTQEIETRRTEIQALKVECGVLTGAIQTTEWSIQRCVADHTSMTPDLAEVAPELAAGTNVEVMSMDEVAAADAMEDGAPTA